MSPHAPPDRWGRRGAILLLVGIAWILQGVGILADAWSPIALPVLHEWIPVPLRAAMWIVPGILALSCTRRRHPGGDSLGYVAAVAVAVMMTTSWGVGLVIGIITNGIMLQDIARGLISATTWAIVGMLFYTVSGWAETPGGFSPAEDDGQDG